MASEDVFLSELVEDDAPPPNQGVEPFSFSSELVEDGDPTPPVGEALLAEPFSFESELVEDEAPQDERGLLSNTVENFKRGVEAFPEAFDAGIRELQKRASDFRSKVAIDRDKAFQQFEVESSLEVNNLQDAIDIRSRKKIPELKRIDKFERQLNSLVGSDSFKSLPLPDAEATLIATLNSPAAKEEDRAKVKQELFKAKVDRQGIDSTINAETLVAFNAALGIGPDEAFIFDKTIPIEDREQRITDYIETSKASARQFVETVQGKDYITAEAEVDFAAEELEDALLASIRAADKGDQTVLSSFLSGIIGGTASKVRFVDQLESIDLSSQVEDLERLQQSLIEPERAEELSTLIPAGAGQVAGIIGEAALTGGPVSILRKGASKLAKKQVGKGAASTAARASVNLSLMGQINDSVRSTFQENLKQGKSRDEATAKAVAQLGASGTAAVLDKMFLAGLGTTVSLAGKKVAIKSLPAEQKRQLVEAGLLNFQGLKSVVKSSLLEGASGALDEGSQAALTGATFDEVIQAAKTGATVEGIVGGGVDTTIQVGAKAADSITTLASSAFQTTFKDFVDNGNIKAAEELLTENGVDSEIAKNAVVFARGARSKLGVNKVIAQAAQDTAGKADIGIPQSISAANANKFGDAKIDADGNPLKDGSGRATGEINPYRTKTVIDAYNSLPESEVDILKDRDSGQKTVASDAESFFEADRFIDNQGGPELAAARVAANAQQFRDLPIDLQPLVLGRLHSELQTDLNAAKEAGDTKTVVRLEDLKADILDRAMETTLLGRAFRNTRLMRELIGVDSGTLTKLIIKQANAKAVAADEGVKALRKDVEGARGELDELQREESAVQAKIDELRIEEKTLQAIAPQAEVEQEIDAPTEPASTEPASTEPASTGPASTGPASTGPASTEPAPKQEDKVAPAIEKQITEQRQKLGKETERSVPIQKEIKAQVKVLKQIGRKIKNQRKKLQRDEQTLLATLRAKQTELRLSDFSEKTRSRIKTLSEQAKDLPLESYSAQLLAAEINKEIMLARGVDPFELAESVFKGNLFGAPTLAVNLLSAGLDGLARNLINASISHPAVATEMGKIFLEEFFSSKSLSKARAKSILKGRSDKKTLERFGVTGAIDTLWSQPAPEGERVGIPNKQKLLKAFTLVSRSMFKGLSAGDSFLSGYNERIGAVLAANEIVKNKLKEAPKTFGLDAEGNVKSRQQLIQEELNVKGISFENALSKAKAEQTKLAEVGVELTAEDAVIRAFQILNEGVDPFIKNQAVRYADRLSYRIQPEGVMGALNEATLTAINAVAIPLGKAGKFRPLHYQIPFTTTLANVANNWLDFVTPIGAYRGLVGVADTPSARNFTEDNRAQLATFERQEKITAGLVGAGLAGLAMSAAASFDGEPDELGDPTLKVEVFGGIGNKSFSDLKVANQEKYSVKISRPRRGKNGRVLKDKDGTFIIDETIIPYKEHFLSFALAPIGDMEDQIREGKIARDDVDFLDKAQMALGLQFSNYLAYKDLLLESTFLKPTKDLIDGILGDANDQRRSKLDVLGDAEEAFIKKTTNVISGYAIPPGVTSDISTAFGSEKVKSSADFKSAFLRTVPHATSLGAKPALNLWGEPIPLAKFSEGNAAELITERLKFIGRFAKFKPGDSVTITPEDKFISSLEAFPSRITPNLPKGGRNEKQQRLDIIRAIETKFPGTFKSPVVLDDDLKPVKVPVEDLGEIGSIYLQTLTPEQVYRLVEITGPKYREGVRDIMNRYKEDLDIAGRFNSEGPSKKQAKEDIEKMYSEVLAEAKFQMLKEQFDIE